MKKFITNNWQKILIFIGAIFIIINVFSKIFTDKTLLADYIKYGKDIEMPEIIENASQIIISNTTTIETPFSPELIKIILLIIGVILFAVILSSIGDRAAAKAKKK